MSRPINLNGLNSTGLPNGLIFFFFFPTANLVTAYLAILQFGWFFFSTRCRIPTCSVQTPPHWIPRAGVNPASSCHRPSPSPPQATILNVRTKRCCPSAFLRTSEGGGKGTHNPLAAINRGVTSRVRSGGYGRGCALAPLATRTARGGTKPGCEGTEPPPQRCRQPRAQGGKRAPAERRLSAAGGNPCWLGTKERK